MHKASRLVLVCCTVLALSAWRVDAAIIQVAAGEVVVNPGNHKCSLREAINNANAGGDSSGGDCIAGDPGADQVILAASIYTLPDVADTNVIYGLSGLPAITSTIDIKGNGSTIRRSPSLFSNNEPCDSNTNFRIFFVDTNGDLTLESVALLNGCASFPDLTGAGGAIFNIGSVTLMHSTVSANQARTSGGGIHNDGTLHLITTTVDGNSVFEGAGGGVVNTATFTSIQSTVSDNETAGAGGAMYNPGTATMANSTLSGNQAEGTGGGLQNDDTATLTNVTVAANTAARFAGSPSFTLGGGIFNDNGTVTLGNTMVVNQLRGTDCDGPITSNGHNLDSDGTCKVLGSDITSANPQIGPLANNGGPTQTHALEIGSPAIDHADNVICAMAPVNDVDQRGVSRPLNGGLSLTCDIGAFELCLDCVQGAPAASPPVLVGMLLMLLASGLYVVNKA